MGRRRAQIDGLDSFTIDITVIPRGSVQQCLPACGPRRI